MAYKSTIGRAVLIATLVNVISDCLNGVDAVGCFGSVANCFRPPDGSFAPVNQEVDPLERDRKRSLELIDAHLRDTVPTDDFVSNMNEILHLIWFEEADEQAVCYSATRSHCLSQLLESKNRDAMLDALMRLKDLSEIRQPGYACDDYTTAIIAEINYQAHDPIGRRNSDRPDMWPRIDELVFREALERAQACLPAYKEHLTRQAINPPRAFATIKEFWHSVFERRFAKVNYLDGISVERAFLTHPKESYEFISKMPHAMEEDEMDIAQTLFDRQSGGSMNYRADGSDLRVYKFDKYLRKPCLGYINLLMDLFESLDFDLRLRRFIPEDIVRATDNDDIVNETRAYLNMCMKLVNEKQRFASFLTRLMLAELPFHETYREGTE